MSSCSWSSAPSAIHRSGFRHMRPRWPMLLGQIPALTNTKPKFFVPACVRAGCQERPRRHRGPHEEVLVGEGLAPVASVSARAETHARAWLLVCTLQFLHHLRQQLSGAGCQRVSSPCTLHHELHESHSSLTPLGARHPLRASGQHQGQTETRKAAGFAKRRHDVPSKPDPCKLLGPAMAT